MGRMEDIHQTAGQKGEESEDALRPENRETGTGQQSPYVGDVFGSLPGCLSLRRSGLRLYCR